MPPEQHLPRIRLHDPLHDWQACPESNSFHQGFGLICPREGGFCVVLSQNGKKMQYLPPHSLKRLLLHFYNTNLHDSANYRVQQQKCGNAGSGGTNSGNNNRCNNNRCNGNRRRNGGGFNTGQANTAVTANDTSSPTVIAPAPAASVTSEASSLTSASATFTPYNAIASSPSGIDYSFFVSSSNPGQLNFTTTSDCGASSYFLDNHFISDIESRAKDIVKADPLATIDVASFNTLSGVSMHTLTVLAPDAQGFVHDILLPVMNVPRLSRHLLSGGTAVLKGVNTTIVKQSYLDIRLFKIPLRKDRDCPIIDYRDLELAPRSNYQTEVAFPTSVISGHSLPKGLALASRLVRSGDMGVVNALTTAARPFIATSTAAPGLPALQTAASALGARLIRGGAMGAASVFTATTSFAAPATTSGLPTSTATATPAMPVTTMVAAGRTSGTSTGEIRTSAPCRLRETSPKRGRFHRFSDRVRHLQITKGTKQPVRNEQGKTDITERLQLERSSLLEPVIPPAHGNCRIMAKYSDHYTKFKVLSRRRTRH